MDPCKTLLLLGCSLIQYWFHKLTENYGCFIKFMLPEWMGHRVEKLKKMHLRIVWVETLSTYALAILHSDQPILWSMTQKLLKNHENWTGLPRITHVSSEYNNNTCSSLKNIKGLDKQNVSAQKCEYFLILQLYHMFWVLKRTVPSRRFFRVHATYVLVENSYLHNPVEPMLGWKL